MKMNLDQCRAWNDWLNGRPVAIQELALKYPPGTKFNMHGKNFFVIAYDQYANQTVGLSVTPIDPSENYALAVAQKQTVCACCLPKLAKLVIP